MVKQAAAAEFQKGDSVLALDNGTLYSAKVLRVQTVGAACRYFLHYLGWHRRFDVWTDEHNICSATDEKKKSAILSNYTAVSGSSSNSNSNSGKIGSSTTAATISSSGNGSSSGSARVIKKIILAVPKGGKLVLKEEDPPSEEEIIAATAAAAAEEEESLAIDDSNTEISDGNSASVAAGKALTGKRKRTSAAATENNNNSNSNSNSSTRKQQQKTAKITRKTPSADSLRQIRKRLLQQDLVDEDDENYVEKLPIPNTLKKFLSDEWSLITNNVEVKRLLQLPKPQHRTLNALVAEFLQSKAARLSENQPQQLHVYRMFFAALIQNFNKALPSILLYRHERAQFAALLLKYPRAEPSRCYGMEHALRLFVRMPKLLSNVFIPAGDLSNALSKLVEFMKFAAKVKTQFIDMAAYETVDEAMSFLAAAPTDLSAVETVHYKQGAAAVVNTTATAVVNTAAVARSVKIKSAADNTAAAATTEAVEPNAVATVVVDAAASVATD